MTQSRTFIPNTTVSVGHPACVIIRTLRVRVIQGCSSSDYPNSLNTYKIYMNKHCYKMAALLIKYTVSRYVIKVLYSIYPLTSRGSN